ncbi:MULTISPECIES: LPS translocon maturation chaperone LptM [unclassified Lonepinella]
MKKHISLIIFTALCASLVGCGVKGPLYYPQDNTQQAQQK